MITYILSTISNIILLIIEKSGYFGIYFLMLLQSFNIPIPSEITMPFSGFLANKGVFNFWLVVLMGTLGNLTGAFFSYKFAKFLVKNGLRAKYKILRILINDRNLELAQKIFGKYGSISVLIGRLVPVVNSFFSFPAGMVNMRLSKFLFFTFLGSLMWSFLLTKIGFVLGANWQDIEVYFRKFDYIILIVILLVIFWAIRRHFNNKISA